MGRRKKQDTETDAAAALLRGLADATRLRVVRLLALDKRPAAVWQIQAALALPRPNIGAAVRVLRRAGWIAASPTGRESLYRLVVPAHPIARFLARMVSEPPGRETRSDLSRLPNRPGTAVTAAGPYRAVSTGNPIPWEMRKKLIADKEAARRAARPFSKRARDAMAALREERLRDGARGGS